MKHCILLLCIFGVLLLLNAGGVSAAAHPSPALIPWPQSVSVDNGTMPIRSSSRIVATAAILQPLADILSDEICMVTGLMLPVKTGKSRAGDIVLAVVPALTNDAHLVKTTSRAVCAGGSYRAVAMASATLLQLLSEQNGNWVIPRGVIKDQPQSAYTGLMLDVARRYNDIDVLKQAVVLCRLYKIKYLHLHLSDDQAFMFPSEKHPQLASKPGFLPPAGPCPYKREDLSAVVKFADARGVTIIPEIEMPGHSSAMTRGLPEVFGVKDPATGEFKGVGIINLANPETYEVLETLIDELCSVFSSAPYIHLGCDESWWAGFEQTEEAQAYYKKTGMNTPKLFAYLINRMNTRIKQHGKRTIVWEGFSQGTPVETDVIVMEWDGRYFNPVDILKAGYSLINVPWIPSVYSSPRDNYEWNKWLLGSQLRAPDQVPRSAPVIGGQMVFWERPGNEVIPRLRATTPARQERLHNPDAGKTFEDFSQRFAATDRLLDALVHHCVVTADGIADPTLYTFADTLVLTCRPALDGCRVLYTLDGALPTKDSPVAASPIVLKQTTTVTLQVFDSQGNVAGFPRSITYACRPVSGAADNVEEASLGDKNKHGSLLWKNRFKEPIDVTLLSAVPGCTIRYTLDGSAPSASSPAYTKPIRLTKSATVTARAFDGNNQPKGEPWKKEYVRRQFIKNRTTGNITAASHGLSSSFKAADGVVDLEEYWDGSPYPSWWQVDLGSVCIISAVDIFTYWDGSRYYQYTVDVSTDEKNWKQVVDAGSNTTPATRNGIRHTFDPVDTRYIRVNMLKNSANIGVHLVEVRAFSPDEVK
jgi:hexosaminidase